MYRVTAGTKTIREFATADDLITYLLNRVHGGQSETLVVFTPEGEAL